MFYNKNEEACVQQNVTKAFFRVCYILSPPHVLYFDLR